MSSYAHIDMKLSMMSDEAAFKHNAQLRTVLLPVVAVDFFSMLKKFFQSTTISDFEKNL